MTAWERTRRRFRSVPCPRCLAKVGAPCCDMGSPGRLLFGNRVHRERSAARRAAER